MYIMVKKMKCLLIYELRLDWKHCISKSSFTFENIAAEFNMTCHSRCCSYHFKGGLQNYMALIGSKAIFMRSPADFCKWREHNVLVFFSAGGRLHDKPNDHLLHRGYRDHRYRPAVWRWEEETKKACTKRCICDHAWYCTSHLPLPPWLGWLIIDL